MADPDRDTGEERRTATRFDNWPIAEYEAWDNWRIERETPREEGGTLEEVAEKHDVETDREWIGMSGAGAGTAYVYDGAAVYEADLDPDEARILLHEESRTDVGSESESSLGERIEEIGEEHGWSWLSSFAREHLEEEERQVHGPGGLELRDTELERRNVPESSPHDLSFTGVHTFVDESGRVHILDRQFDVDADADRADEGEVAVTVDEDCLVAEEPTEKTSRGDADLVAERTREFEAEVDTDRRLWENDVEGTLKEWHRSHIEWPATDS